MTMLFNWSSSQHCYKGEFWHESTSARRWSRSCGQKLRGPFLRATLPMTVRLCAWADNGETKGLITPPPRWISARLLYVWVSAQQRSQWCSQKLRRHFLRAIRFHYLFTLRGTIFPRNVINSGNRTPSRFYPDLLDTSVYIHQLVLKHRSKC